MRSANLIEGRPRPELTGPGLVALAGPVDVWPATVESQTVHRTVEPRHSLPLEESSG